MGSKCMGKLYSHVSQSSEANNANLLAFCDVPVAHGRICRDSRAQERCDSGEIQVGRDSQDKVFFDDDAVGVATVGDASKVPVGRVISKDPILAELLQASLAFRAGAVRVNHAADRSEVSGLELCNCRADLGDATNDLMPGNAGIDSGHRAPLIADLVEVGVTDAAKENFNLNVVIAWFSAWYYSGCKR